MPVTAPMPVMKKFVAVQDTSIGTGFGFVQIRGGKAYEVKFASQAHFDNLIGLGAIRLGGVMPQVVESVKPIEVQSKVEDSSFVQGEVKESIDKLPLDFAGVLTRISGATTQRRLNNVIKLLPPQLLESEEVKAAIVSAQEKLVK